MPEDYKEKYLTERVNFLVSQSELMQARFNELRKAINAANDELEKHVTSKAKKSKKK